MTTTEEQALKAAIQRLSPHKTGRRYPERLREQVTEFTRRRVAEGGSLAAVSRLLDVCEPTLARFLERAPRRTGFKQVVIAEAARTSPKAQAGPVVRAGGVVVEGLSVEEIAQVLRSLTCSA